MNSPEQNRIPDVPTKVSSPQHREPSKFFFFLSHETVARRTKTNRDHAPSNLPRPSSFRLIRRVARPLCDGRESMSRVGRRKSRMRHQLRDRCARFVLGWFAWLEQKARICHGQAPRLVETRSPAGGTRPGSSRFHLSSTYLLRRSRPSLLFQNLFRHFNN